MLIGIFSTSFIFARQSQSDPSRDVFGLTKLWKIHVHLTQENWAKMQPQGGGFRMFGPRQADRIMLNVEQFAKFLTANTMLANMDSFLSQVHNYLAYLPNDTNKFEFLLWDMDLSFGAFFMAGSAEQLQDLSITHPHGTRRCGWQSRPTNR